MKKETKVVLLWRAAYVCWIVGDLLALPAVPFNKLGDWLKRRSHFLQFGEHL